VSWRRDSAGHSAGAVKGQKFIAASKERKARGATQHKGIFLSFSSQVFRQGNLCVINARERLYLCQVIVCVETLTKGMLASKKGRFFYISY